MPHLEPTYLRYVYDSLNKGTLNAENAAALPQGFIGIYEQEFAQKTPVSERKTVLNQLALWALFKGPVSANMAAAILELEEEQMKDLVDNYSSWFNSPENEMYQLYHERLRVYLLQKLKSAEIELLNSKIINILKKALERKTADNLNLYGLQFLGYHQLIETALNKSFEDFIYTCLDNKFIDRQIDISKAFNWSKDPIKEALKLAAFNEDKDIVFELSKSLVNLKTKEKEGLVEIQNLLDVGDDDLVIKRLNSILDGTKENYATSYVFQILSIACLMDKYSSNSIEKRVRLFIDNIENNIPNDQKIVDQLLLIPEVITIKLLVELKNNGIEPDFIVKRCSSINFSTRNFSTFNLKELKYIHELVKNYFKDDEINFLVCSANSAINKNKNADYFFKNIEVKLEKERKQEKFEEEFHFTDSSYNYYGYDQIPEEIIEKTKNRRIINYCCENYLSHGTNKYSKKLYKEKFKIKEKDDLKNLFPFPEIQLNVLFGLDEIEGISKILTNNYEQKDDLANRYNKNLQKRIITCLVNDYGYNLNQLKTILDKYKLTEDLSTYTSIINPYKSIDINWGRTFGLSSRKIIFPKLNQSNINFIRNILKKVNRKDKLEWGHQHSILNENIELDCYLNVCSFLLNKNEDEEKLNNILLSNLRLIEENDKESQKKIGNRNFETFHIIQFLFFRGFNLKLVLELIKSSKFYGSSIDLYRYLIRYYFIENNLKKATQILELLNDLENKTKCSILTDDFLDFFQAKNVKIKFEKGHYDFLNKLLELKKLDSESEKFNQFKLIVLMSINAKGQEPSELLNFDKLVIEKLSEFNTSLWKYLAIKYYSEESDKDIIQLLSLYQDYGLTNIKLKSDDLNSFRLQYNLPDFKTLSSKTMKKKVALHCIKNNLSDYFVSNELHKERLFSDNDLIKFTSTYLNQNNIDIFNCLIDSIVDKYSQLAFKNELYYLINSKSLKTSKISFEYDEERVSIDMAIKAIKCIGDENSLEILNECIAELDNIEDDEVDLETFEVIDGNEEKVKSLYFIITNLWKIGEKKRARKQLKSAFDFYNKMEYETEKETWIKKLDYLAITILTKKDLEKYLKGKIETLESLTVDIIDSILKNNFSNILHEIFTKDHIDRSAMRNMVNAYVKHHSLEKAFSFVKQIQNPVHANAWGNIVVEKVYSIGNNFDGSVAFDKYDLVYNSVESTNALEQMLKYQLFSDVKANCSIKLITSKYDGYVTESEVAQLIKKISHA